MGGMMTLPAPDAAMTRAIAVGKLRPSDIAAFNRVFNSIDKERKGLVPLEAVLEYIKERRSIFTDAVLELLDIQHDGTINFGEFLLFIVSYGLWEREDILKFCFFVFDRDKNGYIEQDEVKVLMNVLWNITPPDKVRGNIKLAYQKLPFQIDGRVEYKEFLFFHKQFPKLFLPAFRIQMHLRRFIRGEKWWVKKSWQMWDIREGKRKRKERKERREKAREQRVLAMRARRKMGCWKYYFMWWKRKDYFKHEDGDGGLTEEELRRLREIAMEKARRLAEMQMKNPETLEWKMYQKKKAKYETKESEEEDGSDDESGDEGVKKPPPEPEEISEEQLAKEREEKRKKRAADWERAAEGGDPDVATKILEPKPVRLRNTRQTRRHGRTKDRREGWVDRDAAI